MRRHNDIICAALLAALGLGGCTGSIGDGEDPEGTDPTSSASCAIQEPFIRRLTVREYRATLRDLLGETDLGAIDLPADTYLDGFDNNVASLGVSTLHVEGYMENAATLAEAVRADATRRMIVFGCNADEGPDAACLESFVRTFGRRAYRRPLETEEVDALLALATSAAGDPDPWQGAEVALQAMLQSPSFLYRIEIGTEDATLLTTRVLTGYEMATRLSYLLWQSTPDDWLLDLAEDHGLEDSDDIAAAAAQMLEDPRAKEGLAAFTDQWLRLPLLDHVERDPDAYPLWSDGLQASMYEETRRLMQDHVWEDGLPLLGALTAGYTYVDRDLAALYGLPEPAEGFERVDLTESATRGGLLTNASLLTIAASSETTAPILRGKFIRDVLLCTPVPKPPANIPEVPEAEPGESVRDQLERHRSDEACSGCHELMDPVGFGFERYDLLGAYREVDASGSALSGEGNVLGMTPGDFRGPLELGAMLEDAPAVEACAMTHLFRFVSGRTETPADSCAIDDLSTAFVEHDGSLRGAIIALVQSDRFRRIGGDQ